MSEFNDMGVEQCEEWGEVLTPLDVKGIHNDSLLVRPLRVQISGGGQYLPLNPKFRIELTTPRNNPVLLPSIGIERIRFSGKNEVALYLRTVEFWGGKPRYRDIGLFLKKGDDVYVTYEGTSSRLTPYLVQERQPKAVHLFRITQINRGSDEKGSSFVTFSPIEYK